jgi:hypothetical protein
MACIASGIITAGLVSRACMITFLLSQIVAAEILADPPRLEQLDVAVLSE